MITTEYLRMLQIFPVRKTNSLDFDLIKCKKLYETLTCAFCRQLLNNPIHLRCSHRFCKECIETYIRINEKKTCPLCKCELPMKEDSKIDIKLAIMIKLIFGDSMDIKAKINNYEEKLYTKILT